MRDRGQTVRAGFIRNWVAVGFAMVCIASATVASPPDGVRGGDWPTYRHDPALSAVSPLKGGLAQPPGVAWSVDLGGPRIPSESVLVRDVTGDGRDEILVSTEAGRLYCLSSSLSELRAPKNKHGGGRLLQRLVRPSS